MQFPQNSFGFGLRHTRTRYLSELAEVQSSKNRSYTQLQAGDDDNFYLEANFGGVQLLRERLGASAHIHAAPPERFLPFAVALPASGDFRFCGQARMENTLLQATGGEWDIRFQERLDYTGCVFDMQALNLDYQRLYGRELPQDWRQSRATVIDTRLLHNYRFGVVQLFHQLLQHPEIFRSDSSCRVLGSEISQLLIRTLSDRVTEDTPDSSYSRRTRGVYSALDFIQAHAAELPTIAELCAIANLSQRSLEYGFRECFGIGPARYLKLVRLNGARETLLGSSPEQVQVSAVAMDWGFWQLGHFSGDYQRLFNELPSETLKHQS